MSSSSKWHALLSHYKDNGLSAPIERRSSSSLRRTSFGMASKLFMDRGILEDGDVKHMHTAAVPTLPKSIFAAVWSWLRRENAQHEFKVHVLEHWSPLGAYLSPVEIAHLARACHVVTFRPGGKLNESPFYLVVEGAVVVMSAEDDATEPELCTRTAGAFFTRHAGQGAQVSRKTMAAEARAARRTARAV